MSFTKSANNSSNVVLDGKVCMYVCKTLFNHASLVQLYTAGFHEGRHTNTKCYKKISHILFTNYGIIYRKINKR